MQHLYSGTGMADKILKAHNHFKTNHSTSLLYSISPRHIYDEYTGEFVTTMYNSNSSAHGLLIAAGLDPGELSVSAPGWELPVPPEYFPKLK